MKKTIIVTGASRGIGIAIARFLIDNGHNVVISARSRAPLVELQSTFPQQTRIVVGDMSDPTLAEAVADLATKEFGHVDGLVINHAMLAPVNRIADADVENWKTHFDINFFGTITLLKAVIPTLRKTKGRIVMTSSGAAIHSYSSWGAYCASKAALKSLGETLAVEEKEITTISVAPGVVDTEMQKELRETHISVMDEKDQHQFLSLKKEGKLLKPEQPGNVIARLVLDAPPQLSGEYFRWNDLKVAAFQDT